MGDLDKVTAFTALYLRQCLTIDFDNRDYYNRKQKIGCAEIHIKKNLN
jgi:hypothetical protein